MTASLLLAVILGAGELKAGVQMTVDHLASLLPEATLLNRPHDVPSLSLDNTNQTLYCDDCKPNCMPLIETLHYCLSEVLAGLPDES